MQANFPLGHTARSLDSAIAVARVVQDLEGHLALRISVTRYLTNKNCLLLMSAQSKSS